jgi:hypothetical protein
MDRGMISESQRPWMLTGLGRDGSNVMTNRAESVWLHPYRTLRRAIEAVRFCVSFPLI